MSTQSTPETHTSESAFQLLHKRIQEELYQMRWTSLRPIQVETAHAVIEGSSHLLVCAMTAGGKTEAAFLPVLSLIADEYESSVRAVYVGPLKALINDQFRRIEDLCQRAEIPVHRWHGDVGESSKKSLLKEPSGVLLITPESIESLFVNHPDKLDAIFGRLSFIVIDEIHSFMGSERGAHLKSLLSRLMFRSKNPVRLIGLSATLGDMDAARRWMWPRNMEQVQLIKSDGEKTVKYRIKGYLISDSRKEKKHETDTPSHPQYELISNIAVNQVFTDAPVSKTGEPSAPDQADAPQPTPDPRQGLAEDLVKSFYQKTALIFANSKKQLELYADLTSRMLLGEKKPNLFKVHHGSLSKAEREATEEALRSKTPYVTFCSSTLEMGIDVGSVSEVGQIGAPWSVSSLKQRMGRSGRRDNEASILRMFIEEEAPAGKATLIDRLYPELLQAIAMSELLLTHWCEPPDVQHLHLSTLVQQIMSVIVERKGIRAKTLFEILIEKGAFGEIDSRLFQQILRSMGTSDLIEQTPEGLLILGLKGEKIAKSFDFYSAFKTNRDLQVLCGGSVIGSITGSPGIGAGGLLILAGRRWKIVDVDLQREEITVEPAASGKPPSFTGSSGADIHPEIHRKMFEVLQSEAIPTYLDAGAQEMLAQARKTAREAGLLKQTIVETESEVIWFTWAGSRVNRTLHALGLKAGLQVDDELFALTFEKTTCDGVRAAYLKFLQEQPAVEELAAAFPMKTQEKYEPYLSPELQAFAFSRNCLDLPGALEIIRRLS